MVGAKGRCMVCMERVSHTIKEMGRREEIRPHGPCMPVRPKVSADYLSIAGGRSLTCDSSALLSLVTVHNPTNDAWVGSVEFTYNGGGAWHAVRCNGFQLVFTFLGVCQIP